MVSGSSSGTSVGGVGEGGEDSSGVGSSAVDPNNGGGRIDNPAADDLVQGLPKEDTLQYLSQLESVARRLKDQLLNEQPKVILENSNNLIVECFNYRSAILPPL